MVRGVSS